MTNSSNNEGDENSEAIHERALSYDVSSDPMLKRIYIQRDPYIRCVSGVKLHARQFVSDLPSRDPSFQNSSGFYPANRTNIYNIILSCSQRDMCGIVTYI